MANRRENDSGEAASAGASRTVSGSAEDDHPRDAGSSRIAGSADDIEAVKALSAAYEKMSDQLSRVIVGQKEVIEQVLVAMFCQGHALLVHLIQAEGLVIAQGGQRVGHTVVVSGHFGGTEPGAFGLFTGKSRPEDTMGDKGAGFLVDLIIKDGQDTALSRGDVFCGVEGETAQTKRPSRFSSPGSPDGLGAVFDQ